MTADVPAAQLRLALALELADEEVAAVGAQGEGEEAVQAEGEAVGAPAPRRDSPQEASLRAAIKAIHHECARDKDAFEMLHEVCHETLQCRERVARMPAPQPSFNEENALDESGRLQAGNAAVMAAPKSPQERLMALVPAAIEKGRSRYHRRTSPAG